MCQFPLPDSDPALAVLALAVLAQALRDAAEAHHEYEETLSEPDPDWASWYAQHILVNDPIVRSAMRDRLGPLGWSRA